MNGKGDRRRPQSVSHAELDRRWEETFDPQTRTGRQLDMELDLGEQVEGASVRPPPDAGRDLGGEPSRTRRHTRQLVVDEVRAERGAE